MTSFGKEVLSGWLQKRSQRTGLWQRRHFLLDEHSLTAFSGKKVQTFRLCDWHDVVEAGKAGDEFVIIFRAHRSRFLSTTVGALSHFVENQVWLTPPYA